jgi:hypothetical protein
LVDAPTDLEIPNPEDGPPEVVKLGVDTPVAGYVGGDLVVPIAS